MGVFNTIVTKKDYACPNCGIILRDYDNGNTQFQSKDLSNRCNLWHEEKQIFFNDCGMIFKTMSNAKWRGITHCLNCKEPILADIIIKKGVIVKIKNLRVMKV